MSRCRPVTGAAAAEYNRDPPWSPVRNHPYMSQVDRLLTGKSPKCLRL